MGGLTLRKGRKQTTFGDWTFPPAGAVMCAVDDEDTRCSVETVGPGEGGRLDQWLATRFPELSRSRWQRLVREGAVLVDGVAADPRCRLSEGVRVSVRRGSLAKAADNEPTLPVPQKLPLDVVFEDDHLLVVNKAAGVVVHPGNGRPDGTVVNAALFHCGSLPDLGDPERPGIVHRIDRETSGLLLLAKTASAGAEMQRQFRDREIEKTYLAVVQGHPAADCGTIDHPIGRHPVARMRMAQVPDGRTAVTHWKVRARSRENCTLLEVRIETGRTHQIRVHMAGLGLPLVGDRRYGFRPSRADGIAARAGRVMLHAWHIGMRHPVSGEAMELEAPVPDDLGLFGDPGSTPGA